MSLQSDRLPPWPAHQQPPALTDPVDLPFTDDEPKIEYVTGYPFMQLARRHGVDYGDVLVTAQWMLTNFGQRACDAAPHIRQHLMKIPLVAAFELGTLVEQPVYLRGAVGHDV